VFSNVYDVVCVSRLSITLDYPFGVSNVYVVVCVSRLSMITRKQRHHHKL
jgi:hypothetical protein